VLWNGTPKATTYVSDKLIKASISTQDIGAPGSGRVEVKNQDTKGGVSKAISVSISNITARISDTVVNDFIWDT
ncbi:hypothetical protein JZU71_01205, partial [bacterium]|nr:hypothetical protein [bacterium]